VIPHYQISRNTLLWLFASQILVLLPHVQRTPIWVILLLAGCMFWRIQIFRGHWSFPKKLIKVSLTLVACGGLVVSFPSFFGLEALVSALLVAYALKLLEMYHKRDALIVLYLSFFLVMTGFLFDQSILLAVFNLFAMTVVITTLTGLYQHSGQLYPWRSFRQSTVMLLQAIPFMILMFVMLPRFPTFWNIPLQKNSPKTGMSDSMSPGDFSRLAQSNDPVMRIHFSHNTTPQADMYWRGLVLSRFDGRRWLTDETLYSKPANVVKAYRYDNDRKNFIESIKEIGLYETDDPKAIAYEVILEETHTQWLYALQNSIPSTPDIWVNFEQISVTRKILWKKFCRIGSAICIHKSRKVLIRAHASKCRSGNTVLIPPKNLSATHSTGLIANFITPCSRRLWVKTALTNSCLIPKKVSVNTSPAVLCLCCVQRVYQRVWW